MLTVGADPDVTPAAAAVAASIATYLYEAYTAEAIQSNAVREIQNTAKG